MKTKVLWALAALNVLLVIGFIGPFGQQQALGQAAGKQARSGDHFLLISGEVNGGNGAVVYIIDETVNGLSARAYDDNHRQFYDMDPIDLDRVFVQPAGGR